MRSGRFLTAFRCGNGCIWLYPHDDCPDCGVRLVPTRIPNEAQVIAHTVVRVNPSGKPVHLGVAKTTSGASTLCVLRGRIRGNGRDRVRLITVDGRIHALARGHRLTGES
ncbi:MAG: hypothetical protein PVF33_13570 [Candidatus Latescibacterota bacterium]